MESDSTADQDTQCGISISLCCSKRRKRSVHCQSLQQFASPKWALAFISFAGILQGFVIQGLTRVVITTLEKRFGFSSTESAIIVSCYDAASLVSIPVVTYFGGRGRKPLWIGWGIALHGIGSLAFSLPHFAAPPYVALTSDQGTYLCGANSTLSGAEAGLNNYKYLFMVANLLNGCGTTAIFTLGMTYLDENVSQKSSSTYHAIYYALQSAAGPAIGFVLGGLSLDIYTNIGESVQIDNTSASWVGAWWLGFVVASVLLLVSSVPLLMLPRKMSRKKEENAADREREVHQSAANIFDDKDPPKKGVKDLISTNVELVRNLPLIFTALANAFDYGLIVGMSAYTPKFFETMYGLSPSKASITMGIVSIAAASLGLITGGVLVTKAKMRVRGIMKFCFLNTILALICCASFLLKCPNTEFAGATLPYPGQLTTSAYVFTSPCNLQCQCSTDFYAPVCGANSMTYFSPCFAGCQGNNNQTFFNCSCVPNWQNQQISATKGKCPGAYCNGLPIFICAFFLLVFFTLMCLTPTLQWVFNRLIGVVFPIIVGRVLDLTCLVWSSKLGQSASCKMYSTQRMSLYLFLIVLCGKICSLACYGVDQLLYKPVKKNQNNVTNTVEI